MRDNPYDVMDLKALRCFWAMAKCLSLTNAGIELGISEAAVSQRIKSLEKRLGVKLYEARGGRVRLTHAGERTMELAVGLFDRIEAFESSLSADEAYEIALCTQDTVLHYLLPPVVETLSRTHPSAFLRLLTRSPDDCVQLVRTNEADIAIVAHRELPEEIQFHLIAEHSAFLLLPRGHPLVGRARNDFGSLLNDKILLSYPLIASESQIEDRILKETFGRLGLPLNIGLEVGTFETVKHYVARGLGIAVVSGLCLTEEDKVRMEVIEVPTALGGGTTYGAILRRDKTMTPPLEKLLQLLSKQL